MDENNRNFILAIVLSIGVQGKWGILAYELDDRSETRAQHPHPVEQAPCVPGRVDAVANFAQPPVADDHLRIRGLGFGNGFVHCGRERNGMTAVLEILTDCESGRIVIVQHEDAQREIGSVID